MQGDAQEVFVEESGDVGLCVTLGFEEGRQFLEVGDGVQVLRGLFNPEGSIEIGPDAAVF